MDYRDKFYKKYASSHTANLYDSEVNTLKGIRQQFFVWKDYFGKFLPIDKSISILEIGCGNGGFVYWLHELGYSNSCGIDISEEQVGLAKKQGIINVEVAGLVEFLNSKKDKFDIIFARDVIEHFNKLELLEILELVFASLKSGGKFIVKTPNGESPFSGRYRFWDFTNELSVTKASIWQLFSITGFKEIEVFSEGPVVHGVKSFVRFICWKLIELLLRFYLIAETGSGNGIFTQNLIAAGVKSKKPSPPN